MSLTKKLGIAGICLILTVGAVFAIKASLDAREEGKKADKQVNNVSTSDIKDGEFYGEANGYGGPLKVKVTIQDGKMKNIEVVSHNETPEYFKAAREVIDRILAGGSVDVDAVSGATVSSNAIKNAVADALSKAGIKTKKLKNTKAKPAKNAKIVKAGGRSARAGTVGISSRDIADGTYEGVGRGYGGQIRVRVTVSGGLITNVNVLSHHETTAGSINYYAKGASVISRILGRPGKSVDTVSGATLTSRGIIDAVNNALSKAPGKPTVAVQPVPQNEPPAPSPLPIPSESKLDDGDWYGTAISGQNFENDGPSVVMVTVANGKIQKVTSVLYTDDDAHYKEKKDRLLAMLAGLDTTGINTVNEQLREKKGKYYDAVASATVTAKGHMSAVMAALDNSVKSYQNKQNGNVTPGSEKTVAWMQIVGKPERQYFGEPIDLQETKLRLHFSDKSEKEISFSEIERYGVTCNRKNGEVFMRDNPDVKYNNYIEIKFHQKDTGAHAKYNLPLTVKKKIRFATRVDVEYVDGTHETIPLKQEEFRYSFAPKKEIKGMTIFENETELTKGYRWNDFYFFDLPKDPGADSAWIRTRYRIDLKEAKIKSFTVEPKGKVYYKGDKCDLSKLIITAQMSDGGNKTYRSWKEATDAGFTSNPKDGTVLDKVGIQKIKISVNSGGKSIEQEFSIEVKDSESSISVTDHEPNRIEVYREDKMIYQNNIDLEQFKVSGGYQMLKKPMMKAPETLKDSWNAGTFTVVVYNSKNQKLATEVVKSNNIGKYGVMDVKILNYPEDTMYNVAYLRVMIDWQLMEGKSGSRRIAPAAVTATPSAFPAERRTDAAKATSRGSVSTGGKDDSMNIEAEVSAASQSAENAG